jgi:hypothetical protein
LVRDPGLLREVRRGDRPSASQHNLMIELLRRRHHGELVTQVGGDTFVRSRAKSRPTIKLVVVTSVMEDRLRVQEISVTSLHGTWERTGPSFDAAPWPSQQLSDYEDKSSIVMIAHKFGSYWVVQMTGDRVYGTWPADFCDECT